MAGEENSTNSLGLDFDRLGINEHNVPVPEASPSREVNDSAATPAVVEPEVHEPSPKPGPIHADKEKRKPYVNPERVKTGGSQRDKLTEQELAERMERIKQQNEKIKQRQVDVQADIDAFETTQEAERIRLAQSRKIQEQVNRTREHNARRKMEKVKMREWDSGKSTGDWKQNKPTQDAAGTQANIHRDADGSARGSTRRGGPRGRGRSRGGSNRDVNTSAVTM